MSNLPVFPSAKKQKKITDEINEKVTKYESRMAPRLDLWAHAAELYDGRSYTQRENSKLSPNSSELYKAIRAISNMQFRMLTGVKPFFELIPLDIMGVEDDVPIAQRQYKLLKSEHYVSNQLALSKFNKGLHRSLNMLNLYGSVAVHEQYEPLRSSFLGRKRFITSYRPVSMINCAFALDSFDIEESGWCCINDVQARNVLHSMIKHDPKGKLYNLAIIKDILNDDSYSPKLNTWVTQRMLNSGFMDGDFTGGIERATYYGPLECQDDGEEYAVEVVNRKAIVRMETFEGIRPVRIATVDCLDNGPLGIGLADRFSPQLQKIDNAESSLLNMITLAGACMSAKQKGLGDEDMEYAIRNFGILNLEGTLTPVGPSPQNIQEVALYREAQVQGFRQGSGATNTLQALVSGESTTATEVSLSMNEAVRNISVGSEIVAPTLIADHIKVILQNGQKFQTQPFVLNINKVPMNIYPSDIQIDVDVEILTATDQNFRPARVKNMLAALQLMATAGPDAIKGSKINIGPTLLSILKGLDVPDFEKTIEALTDEDLIQMSVIAQMQGQQGPQVAQGNGNVKGPMPAPAPVQPADTLNTPVGSVASAPGDEQSSLQAIRQSTIQQGREILRS